MKPLLLLAALLSSFFAQSQIITTIGGTGVYGCTGSGGPATSAQIGQLNGITLDTLGNVYVSSYTCRRVFKIDRAGIITTVAGIGVMGSDGDGGPATAAKLGIPAGLATDRSGNLFICDNENSVIRKVNAAGIISTIAGDATVTGGGYTGDGGPAVRALLSGPVGLATDAAGNLFIADANNNVVRKIATSGIITRVAGNGYFAYTGDGGSPLAAGVQYPVSVAVAPDGTMYIADEDNHLIRKVSGGIITTIAGNGVAGYTGDGGPASAAQLHYPKTLSTDRFGNLYIADVYNHAIRKINTAGIMSTYAGNGTMGHSGDGGPAVLAQMNLPQGVAVDKYGFAYISELDGAYVRKTDTCSVPDIAPITGDSLLCEGDTATLHDAAGGGMWISRDTAVATISSGGRITGMRRGLTTITYTTTNACATLQATKSVTVGPFAGVITGDRPIRPGVDTFCYIAYLSTTGAPGGVWGLTDTTIANISGGFVRPLYFNLRDTAFYAVTDSCGTDTAFFSFVLLWCPDLVSPAAPKAAIAAIKLYPNPAGSLLHIAAATTITEVSIINTVGQTMYTAAPQSPETIIDIAALPPGVYYVRTNAGIARFLKE